jgi:hypothetical protein
VIPNKSNKLFAHREEKIEKIETPQTKIINGLVGADSV